MGNFGSDSKILKFSEVVKKIQILDKEFLVNDIMEIQKFKKHNINLVLMDIDKEKIRKSKEEPIENLIKNSTRVHTLIEDEYLNSIKSDILTQDEIDNLPIKVY